MKIRLTSIFSEMERVRAAFNWPLKSVYFHNIYKSSWFDTILKREWIEKIPIHRKE